MFKFKSCTVIRSRGQYLGRPEHTELFFIWGSFEFGTMFDDDVPQIAIFEKAKEAFKTARRN